MDVLLVVVEVELVPVSDAGAQVGVVRPQAVLQGSDDLPGRQLRVPHGLRPLARGREPSPPRRTLPEVLRGHVPGPAHRQRRRVGQGGQAGGGVLRQVGLLGLPPAAGAVALALRELVRPQERLVVVCVAASLPRGLRVHALEHGRAIQRQRAVEAKRVAHHDCAVHAHDLEFLHDVAQHRALGRGVVPRGPRARAAPVPGHEVRHDCSRGQDNCSDTEAPHGPRRHRP
mmetsp:Transcript_113435/g.321315  ORF Transcript_113435/g.321315 Transcript_113435/m.321315 type:complete len:229 (-) Transcript_113435:201-887(-)